MAKFLEILMTGSLENATFLLKQSVSVFREVGKTRDGRTCVTVKMGKTRDGTDRDIYVTDP